MKFFRSKSFLISLVVAIGATIFLWDTIVSTIFSTYIKSYFRTQFGAEITVDKVLRKKSAWVLKAPAVTFSGGVLNAKQVAISYEPYLWDRKVEIKLKIVDPLVELNDQTLALLDGFKKMDVEKGFIDYRVFVEVENGKAVAEHLPPLFFHLNEELGPHSLCTFCGGFSTENQVKGSYVFQEEQHPVFNITFNDFDLEAASKWAEHMQPGAMEWTSQGGRIDGTWVVDSDFHFGSGDLKISELSLTSVDNPFTIHIPSLATVKGELGTAIILENKGKLQVEVGENFLIDLYHFGGNLYLNSTGQLQGSLAGSASLGALQPSLQLVVDVDQTNTANLFQYRVNGPLHAIMAQIPQKYEHVLENDFAGTVAELQGSCVAIERGVEFCTNLKLTQNDIPLLEDFNIYCRVDPTTSKFIDEGSFNVQKMNMEKVLSPFLFLDKQFKLTGEGYFEGTWNPSLMHVRYRPDGVVLEGESLVMDIPTPPEEEGDGAKFFTGEHFFDFERNHQYGRLYVSNGFYLEKRTDLLFSNVNTQIVFEGKTLTAAQLQTISQGISFEGSVSLDYSSPLKKTFDLDIAIEKMHGKVSQFQDFLSHFPQPLFLQRLPIEGKILSGRGGNKISLHFITGKCNVEADIKGVLVEGQTDGDSSIRADQISFEFAYNHENKTLGLTHLGGFLKLGLPATEKVFRIQGEGLHFKNYLRHEGDFSIALRDDRQEWIKLAGEISPVQTRTKGEQVRITFDPARSHLQDGQAIHCTCELSDWENVEELDLSFQLKVPGVVKELQQGVQCGLISMPEPFVEQLKEWIEEENTDGQLFVQVGYDRSTSLVNVQGRGKQIQLGKHYYDQVNLEAKKRHHTWMIEQLQFDDFSISADLQKEEAEEWKLNFLGVRWGSALLAGLEGTLLPEARELKARINLFELDLAKALTFPKFKEYIGDKKITGELKGVGEFCIKLTNEAPGWSCDVLGNLSARQVSYEDVAIEDSNNVSFHLLSDKTIALRNFKTKALGVDWLVEKCCYCPKVGQLDLENVAFQYPVDMCDVWMSAMQNHFPDLLNQSLLETIEGMKSQGNMEGFFDLALSDNIYSFNLRLKDDTYAWKGEPYNVKNFSLTSTPNEKSFLFQTTWQKTLPWVNIRTGNGEKGIVVLAEENPVASKDAQTLTLDWKNLPNKPLIIERVSGAAFGIAAELLRRGEDFAGKLTLHLPTLAPLLIDEHLQAIQKAQLKGAYDFEGDWNIPFHRKEWLKEFTFYGAFTGSGCALKGYCYDHVQGVCSISPGRFLLQDCHIEDIAFQGNLKQLLIDFSDDKQTPTHFQLSHLQLENLRPHLIKKDPSDEPFGKKNLTINQLQIAECSGDLSDPESYEGNGFLQFSTQTRKGIESTPFALPAEILSRLGLNSAIMTPVRGTAIFDIGHGRCYVSKLKDTYSQGKLSKFYIYAPKEPSYVDFDGNVHLQVRIKHYNLLFKLSEMLTINVRGTLGKPLYYLQK